MVSLKKLLKIGWRTTRLVDHSQAICLIILEVMNGSSHC